MAELLIDCEEDRTLRAVLVGMLRGLRPGGPVVEKGRQGVVLAVKEFGHSFAHVRWGGGRMESWVRTGSLAVVEKMPDRRPPPPAR